VLWIALRVGTEPAVPTGEVAEVRSGETAAGLPSTGVERIEGAGRTPSLEASTPTMPETSGSRVRLRSSAGLPLTSAEIEVEPARWKPVEVVDGACETAGALRVRAPGHLPSALADREVVLEPDALLVLEAPELRGCLATVEPSASLIPMSPQLREEWEATSSSFLTSGFVGTDRWAIAVSSRRASRFGEGQVYVDFCRKDYRIGWILFRATGGARIRWEFPCNLTTEVAPLDVRVARSAEDSAGDVDLHAWRMGSEPQQLVRQEFPWGTVAMMPPKDVFFTAKVGSGESTARIEGVPLGLRYSLTAGDRATRSYGRVVFDHDGTPRTVEMQGPIVIHGRLHGPGEIPVRRASFEWSHLHDAARAMEDMTAWGGATPGLALPEDGAFEIRSPSRTSPQEGSSLAPPPELLLHIDAPGYEPFEGVVALPARRVDCGTIVLTPRAPEIVLAPGHGLKVEDLESMWVRMDAVTDLAWFLHSAIARPDGTLALLLEQERKEGEGTDALYRCQDPRSESAASSELPKPPSGLIAVHALTRDHGDAGWAFRRKTDGTYEALPRIDVRADVHCRTLPSTRRDWTIGWEWNGLWDTCALLGAESEGERRTFDWSFPAQGAKLWWSPSRWPPWFDEIPPTESGTMAIEGASLRLELP